MLFLLPVSINVNLVVSGFVEKRLTVGSDGIDSTSPQPLHGYTSSSMGDSG